MCSSQMCSERGPLGQTKEVPLNGRKLVVAQDRAQTQGRGIERFTIHIQQLNVKSLALLQRQEPGSERYLQSRTGSDDRHAAFRRRATCYRAGYPARGQLNSIANRLRGGLGLKVLIEAAAQRMLANLP